MHIQSPLIRSFLDESRLHQGDFCPEIWFKMESAQPSGSFKLRGIGHLCQSKVQVGGARRLVSSSGGNAGYSAAWSARLLGVPIDIFVPQTTSARVQSRMRALGAHVHVVGQVWDEAHQAAMERSQEPYTALIHPFDDPLIWQGHASMIHEIAASGIKPDLVILSVGGGGLLAGVAQGLRDCDWGDLPILAVETQGAASLSAAITAGQPVRLDRIETVAHTLGARQVCEEAYRVTQLHSVQSLCFSDVQALSGCQHFLDLHRVQVEPACGVSYAALDQLRSLYSESLKRIVLIVCGGIAGF